MNSKMMKSLFVVGLSIFAFSANAQIDDDIPTDLNSLHFVDKNGNVVADGTELTVSEIEETPVGNQINSGLFVKNTTSEPVTTCAYFEISSIDNGSISCCFPMSCQNYGEVGTYETSKGEIEGNGSVDFQTEWLSSDFGTCTATFQLAIYSMTFTPGSLAPSYELKAKGPKVKINFVNNDPAGVDGIVADNAKPVAYYNVAGQLVSAPLANGITIVKYPNGKTVKIRKK